jgi:hypothetical protein
VQAKAWLKERTLWLLPQEIPKDWLVTMMIGILGAWGCILLCNNTEGKHMLDADTDIQNLQSQGVLQKSEFVDLRPCTTDAYVFADFIHL